MTTDEGFGSIQGDDWTIEWNPNPRREQWNWHIYSFHKTVEQAQTAFEKLMQQSGIDKDRTHWRIFQ